MTTQALPTLFVPHGAGPCFFMTWEPADAWSRMADWLRAVPERIGTRPKAVLVVSGHWEAPVFTVNAQRAPPLLYDYSGFPPHTYELTYPVPGSPALAERVQALLGGAGFTSEAESARGLDHGVFIPMKVIYPAADVPIVQLSLRQGLEPAEHLAMGRALAPLRREGVLIVGSGMSYHNMRRFRFDDSTLDPDSVRFDEWLAETVALPAPAREQRLSDWAAAPGGRAAHPREEHLLPLHVVAGAAGVDAGQHVLQDRVLGSLQSAFMFGG
ncbi:MAG: class III extradiol ring-cleavage dioxygenase [Pseudomonadota bacterium]|uniref:DODA-type extradiol aromatic ring-opening family dioxygenase n=1 Tax=Halomonas sp. IOP_31 TaxID=2876584 RepID=UPI001E332267|nr:class III extradiol ring-cleavage dioxygenase [Halomonas sp. IOP_31]MCD6009789.1 dioxygenase [Halomonas sp. IOP_31]MEA3250918.1 class III extradiol ring-cleavage dioxygenase [Pseudomonadota bacterium]